VIVPCPVILDGRTYEDGVDLTPADFYRRLISSSGWPTTSQPSVEVFARQYRQLLAGGTAIISLHISSTLSGIYNAACLAAQQFPDSSIVVIDSRQLSMGLGLLAIEIAMAAARGGELAELTALAREVVTRLRVVGALETLKYVQKGGRISRIVALLGTLLAVKPLFMVRDGVVLPIGRVRTRRVATQRLVEFIADLGPLQALAVIHAAAPDRAQEVLEMLKGIFPQVPIWLSEAGPTIGTHVGPGAIGVACILAT
jgi:DegV family protein with EDD domain